MLLDDPAVRLLYSREKRKIVASFHSDVPECRPDPEILRWHRKRQESHSVREILLVLSGSTVQQINGRFYQCDARTVVMFDHNEIHTLGYDCNSNGLHCWLTLLPDDLRWVFMHGTEKYSSSRIYGFIAPMSMVNSLKNLWDEIGKPGIPEDRKMALLAEISGCLAQIFAEVYLQAHSTQRRYRKRDEDITKSIQLAKDYLREHCGCTLREIASITGYSPTHFARLFKQFTGTGFMEYVNLVRQEKYLKYYTSMLTKQLAGELGFSSSSALAHWHKKYLSSNPHARSLKKSGRRRKK